MTIRSRPCTKVNISMLYGTGLILVAQYLLKIMFRPLCFFFKRKEKKNYFGIKKKRKKKKEKKNYFGIFPAKLHL